jgi:hypothetical protein
MPETKELTNAQLVSVLEDLLSRVQNQETEGTIQYGFETRTVSIVARFPNLKNSLTIQLYDFTDH